MTSTSFTKLLSYITTLNPGKTDQLTPARKPSLTAALNHDVLHLIFGQLNCADLAALCLTSQSVRLIAEPLLYAAITIRRTITHSPPIEALLNSILRRPILAQQIRRISLTGFDKISGYVVDYEPPCVTARLDMTLASQAVSAVGISAAAWQDGLAENDLGVLVALLVSNAQNLVSLSVSEAWPKNFLMRQKVFTRGRVQHLEQLSFEWGDEDIDEADEEFTTATAALWSLPKIRHLTTWMSMPSQAPPVSTLTDLRTLDLSDIYEGHLIMILKACPQLRSFAWRLTERCGKLHDTLHDKVDIGSLMDAVCLRRDTLEALTISVSGIYLDEASVDYGISRVDQIVLLSTLHTLRHLRIPLELLSGTHTLSDSMPSSLECLELTDDLRPEDRWSLSLAIIAADISILLANRSESRANLRSIMILLEEDEDQWDESIRSCLQKRSRHYGIEIDMIDCRFENASWAEYEAETAEYSKRCRIHGVCVDRRDPTMIPGRAARQQRCTMM